MADRVDQVQRAFTAYTVERELGSGGMATVYLAHDKKHDRKVAIKILHALTLTVPDKLVVIENWFEELKAKSRK